MITKSFNIEFEAIKPEVNFLLQCMGYPDQSKPELILDSTRELLEQSKGFVEAEGGFRIFNDKSVIIQNGEMILNNITFNIEKIISRQLVDATNIAFIVVTLGKKYDDWITQFFKGGDPFKGYIADSIGSELVENAADFIEKQLVNHLKNQGLNCTNRFSPGYCGWHVSDQHKFFSFLPEKFCSVKLSDSALMNPIKSISAIIGIGKKCNKKDYNCSLCSMEDCYKRNRKK